MRAVIVAFDRELLLRNGFNTIKTRDSFDNLVVAQEAVRGVHTNRVLQADGLAHLYVALNDKHELSEAVPRPDYVLSSFELFAA